MDWDTLAPAGIGVGLFVAGVIVGAAIVIRVGRLLIDWMRPRDD